MADKEKLEQLIQFEQDYINNIVKKKYCITEDEKNFEDVIQRQKRVLLENYPEEEKTIDRIIEMFSAGRYIPAGSILFGLGNIETKCSLSNCYYIPIQEDSIEGIFDAIKEIGRTYSYRGGIGTDISILRAKNDKVRNSAKKSSGAVSFMPLFSNATTTLGQQGRRGALLATIDVRHPDTLDFIWAKARPEQVFGVDPLTGKTADISGANISVKVTDDFMKAVNEDKDWTFIFPEIHCSHYQEWDGDYDKWISKGYPVKEYKTMKARDILRQIAEASWMKADPGLQFWGNMINWSDNNFDTKLSPRCTNACGEQPLTDYGNCLLSALVFHSYVKNPYTNFAEFDNDLFLEDVHYGIRFLDMMIDLNRHPLPEQTKIDQYSRRVGQEFTGLGDLLAMMGLEYGSDESCEFIDGLLYSKVVEELKTTLLLAKEKGCAPCLNTKTSRKKYLDQPYIKRILDRMFPNQRKLFIEDAMEYGLRNSSLNTVGPCGSLSIVSKDCTTGIEPLFAVRYSRKTRVEGAEYAEIVHYPILLHADSNVLELTDEQIKKKYCYKSAYDLNFNDRIKLQSAVQKWTGASVSSTLNLRNDCTIEDIYNIYLKAYQSGLKGITVYRDGCKEGVLSAKTGQTDPPNLDGRQRAYRDIQYWKGVKVYIVVTVDDKERPIEVFASIPHEAGIDEHTGQYSVAMFNERLGYWTSICRLASISLRAGISLEEVIRHLEKSSPAMTELPNILTRVLQKYLNTSEEVQIEIREGRQKGQLCTVCREYGVVHTGGCKQCLLCGNTICG